MEIIRITVGAFATNCYIVYSQLKKGKGAESIVIDPGGDCEKITSTLRKYNLKPKSIINTHGHVDHIYCNEILKMVSGSEVWMSKEEADIAADAKKNGGWLVGENTIFAGVDRYLEEGEVISLGGRPLLRVVLLPGHSPEGVGLVSVDKKVAFLGDLIFEQEGYGRTDLYGGDAKALKESITKVFNDYPSDMMVFPGHGESFKLLDWENW